MSEQNELGSPQEIAREAIDLRTKYEALKLERDTERGLRESSEQENDRLRTERDALAAHGKRMDDLLRGETREKTAENIFMVSYGRLNSRSVYILADELFASRTAPAKETPCPKCGGIEKVQAGDMAIHECDRCYHCWDATAPAKP